MSASQSVDKTSLLRAFNKHFFDFLDEILRILPENKEVQTARVAFENIKKANPTAIVKVWFKYVHTPYSEIIEQGDIGFFVDKDYSTDLEKLKNQGRVMDMIDKLREPIKNMSPENMAHSTKYIQNLGKLSVLYSAVSG